MQFFKVKRPAEVQSLIREAASRLPAERVRIEAALGRVLAEEVRSPVDLPAFDRGIVDGYAVRAADTFGASAGLPAYLTLIGEVPMGEDTELALGPGEAVKIATGGMLPAHADAVVMLEYTDSVDETTIEVTRPVAPGENVVRRGDDLKQGEVMLPRGHRLRPQDLGALAGVGLLEVAVTRQPRVALIPTGDEIIPPDREPGPGQIRDINTYALAGLVTQSGGVPIRFPIVPDRAEALRERITEALAVADVVLLSGGSSVGTRDLTLEALRAFPGAQLLVHGVSIRPGKPVIVVALPAGERLKMVFGLPGNPTSALVAYDLFVEPLLQRMLGLELPPWAERRVPARMRTSFASDAGKEETMRVRLRLEEGVLWAEPVLGKSALISTMVEADGKVVIPEGVEGLEAGEEVEVVLF
jgi:molybdopterin molybdotransferase